MNNQANAAGLAAEEELKEKAYQLYKEMTDIYNKEELPEAFFNLYTLIVDIMNTPGSSWDIRCFNSELFLLRLLYQATKNM